jgi:Fe2+ or Zn2+ uptake regulation protein/O6-methylguanine-DNA--protein-cysteine methyltransferase
MIVEDAGDLLRRHQLRSTPQRRAILKAFRSTAAEHLSAEEVLARAAQAVPDLGRGTVYATLAELAEVGLLASVGVAEPVRYETNLAPHDHFHCRLCLRLFDVDLGGRELGRRPPQGFEIESVAARAEGTCRECTEYLAGLGHGASGILQQRSLAEEGLAELTCASIPSPVGALGVAASADGIVRLGFEDHADYGGIVARAKSRRGPTAARWRLRELAATIERYFGGDARLSADVLDWRLAGEQQQRVLSAVRRIPYAESLSYDRLGDTLSPYDRGVLVGSNPLALLIPCHRVSRGSERPELYVGGLKRLQFLRELEIPPLV